MTTLETLAWRLRHARARYSDGHIDTACFAGLCAGIIEDMEALMTPTLESLTPRIEALRRQGFHPAIDSEQRNLVKFYDTNGCVIEPGQRGGIPCLDDCPRRIAESLVDPLRYLSDDDKGTLDNMAEVWLRDHEVSR